MCLVPHIRSLLQRVLQKCYMRCLNLRINKMLQADYLIRLSVWKNLDWSFCTRTKLSKLTKSRAPIIPKFFDKLAFWTVSTAETTPVTFYSRLYAIVTAYHLHVFWENGWVYASNTKFGKASRGWVAFLWGKSSPCISFRTNSLLLSKKAMFFCKSGIPDHHCSYCHQRLQPCSVEFVCLWL